MKVRFRKGISGTTSRERAALIAVEAMARRFAIVRCVDERCAQHPIGLAECSDLDVFSSILLWYRSKRAIMVRVAVYVTPGMQRFELNWRVTEADQQRLASQLYGKKRR